MNFDVYPNLSMCDTCLSTIDLRPRQAVSGESYLAGRAG